MCVCVVKYSVFKFPNFLFMWSELFPTCAQTNFLRGLSHRKILKFSLDWKLFGDYWWLDLTEPRSGIGATPAWGLGYKSCYLALDQSLWRPFAPESLGTEGPGHMAWRSLFLFLFWPWREGSCLTAFPSAPCQELQCCLNLIDGTRLGLGFSCQMELLLKVNCGTSLLFIFLDMSQKE